ncbi:MAG TPA: hypothetical protein VFZ56_09010 [Gemmatimonadaceae bacterium]
MKLTLVGTRPRMASRTLGVAVCLAATAMAACNGRDRPDTPRTAETTAAESHRSPRLPKPIGDYTSAEFQTFVSSLYFGGSEVTDVSVADTTTETAPAAVLIIEAMSTANDVSLADPGSNGTVIARLRNLQGNDNTFGTKPGAAFEYYVIVERGTEATGAAFQIVELTRAQNPTQRPVRVSGGTIRRCAEDEPPPAWSSARFGGCEHGERSASARRTSFFGVGTLWAQGRGSAWVSCREGCCELTMATTVVDS